MTPFRVALKSGVAGVAGVASPRKPSKIKGSRGGDTRYTLKNPGVAGVADRPRVFGDLATPATPKKMEGVATRLFQKSSNGAASKGFATPLHLLHPKKRLPGKFPRPGPKNRAAMAPAHPVPPGIPAPAECPNPLSNEGLTHMNHPNPTVQAALADLETAAAQFEKVRGQYQDLTDKAAAQNALADEAEADATRHAEAIHAGIRDGSLNKGQVQELALAQTTAATLGQQYRGFAAELLAEAELIKPKANGASLTAKETWNKAIEVYADAEFQTILDEIGYKLEMAIRLQIWKYQAHPDKRNLEISYSNDSPAKPGLFCAMKYLEKHIDKRLDQPRLSEYSELTAVLMNKPTFRFSKPFAPFNRKDG